MMRECSERNMDRRVIAAMMAYEPEMSAIVEPRLIPVVGGHVSCPHLSTVLCYFPLFDLRGGAAAIFS